MGTNNNGNKEHGGHDDGHEPVRAWEHESVRTEGTVNNEE